MKDTVITFGTFDLFHIGHLNILERASSFGNRLVGVSSDNLNYNKKMKNTIYTQSERLSIISALRCVDRVFLEESLELKRDYIIKHDAKILVMGDDWIGRFDGLKDVCEVIYLPRTPSISTTATVETIRQISSDPVREEVQFVSSEDR